MEENASAGHEKTHAERHLCPCTEARLPGETAQAMQFPRLMERALVGSRETKSSMARGALERLHALRTQIRVCDAATHPHAAVAPVLPHCVACFRARTLPLHPLGDARGLGGLA